VDVLKIRSGAAFGESREKKGATAMDMDIWSLVSDGFSPRGYNRSTSSYLDDF